MLRHDGTLTGKPQITHNRLIGDGDRERASVTTTLSAIINCFPIAIPIGLRGLWLGGRSAS